MEKWEYKYVSPEYLGRLNGYASLPKEETINALGDQGWELVGVAPLMSGSIGSTGGSLSVTSVGGGFSTTVTLIFKRRKP